jgi:hypothetical protein
MFFPPSFFNISLKINFLQLISIVDIKLELFQLIMYYILTLQSHRWLMYQSCCSMLLREQRRFIIKFNYYSAILDRNSDENYIITEYSLVCD